MNIRNGRCGAAVSSLFAATGARGGGAGRRDVTTVAIATTRPSTVTAAAAKAIQGRATSFTRLSCHQG